MNPIAVAMWIFLALLGFLIFGTATAAATGACIGLGLSLLVTIFGR